MGTAYYATGAYRSAVAHPVFVHLWSGWGDQEPVTVGFQTREQADAFIESRPEPLADLVERGRGVVAVRRLVAHPSAASFTPRDDFPQRVPVAAARAYARTFTPKVMA